MLACSSQAWLVACRKRSLLSCESVSHHLLSSTWQPVLTAQCSLCLTHSSSCCLVAVGIVVPSASESDSLSVCVHD
jgi:hypothetical protein